MQTGGTEAKPSSQDVRKEPKQVSLPSLALKERRE